MGSPRAALSPPRGSPRTPTKSPLGRSTVSSDPPLEELDLGRELYERVSKLASAPNASQAPSTGGTPTKIGTPREGNQGESGINLGGGDVKQSRSERLGRLVSKGLAQVNEVVTDGPFLGVVILGLAIVLGVEWLRKLPIFPVIAVCYVIWGVAQKRTKEQVRKARRQWELEVAETKAETALESVDWLNCLLRMLWRHVYEPQFALQLCTILQKKLSKSRPKFMQTLEFTHFALGTAPPTFGPAKIVRHMGEQALDIDFAFESEHPEVVIQSRMQLGTLFYVPGSFSSTIKVTSLKISGKLRCRPFATERIMLVSFTGEPKMHIDISLWGISMKALQPILTWLTAELKSAIAKQWVEPRRFCLELRSGALPNQVKNSIKAQGGIMKVAVLQVRLFDGAAFGTQSGTEIQLQLKVRGVKVRSKMVLSRREGGGVIFAPESTPPEQEFKLPGNTGVATLVCSTASDFHMSPVLGTCSIQHKWLHDGSTCFWHNIKGGKPVATRTFEPYTTWVPLRDVGGTEVGEACIWSSPSWFYGVPETSTIERPVLIGTGVGPSERDKIVNEALCELIAIGAVESKTQNPSPNNTP